MRSAEAHKDVYMIRDSAYRVTNAIQPTNDSAEVSVKLAQH